MGEINRRMFELMLSKKKKAIDLARLLDVPPNTISAWKSRGSDPKAHQMKQIAEFLGVSQHYLETGEEEKPFYADKETDDYANRLFKDPNLRMLLDATDNLGKEDIDLLVQFAKKMKGTRED